MFGSVDRKEVGVDGTLVIDKEGGGAGTGRRERGCCPDSTVEFGGGAKARGAGLQTFWIDFTTCLRRSKFVLECFAVLSSCGIRGGGRVDKVPVVGGVDGGCGRWGSC